MKKNKNNKKKYKKSKRKLSKDKQQNNKEVLRFKIVPDNNNDEEQNSEYNINDIEKNIQNILDEQGKIIGERGIFSSSESEPEEIEKIEDIKEDFLDIKKVNDTLNIKGKILKNTMLEFMDLSGNLNNKNNPFINNNKKEKLNDSTNGIKIETFEIQKEKEDPDNKFKNKPPKTFDSKQAKELNSAFIELNEEDKLGDNNNYWYKKFIYLGKNLLWKLKRKLQIKENILSIIVIYIAL